MNDEIEKLDGMIKIKGKCGYEIIGGCRELRKLKAKLERIKEICNQFIAKCNECETPDTEIDCIDCTIGGKAVASYKVLNIIEGAEDERLNP